MIKLDHWSFRIVRIVMSIVPIRDIFSFIIVCQNVFLQTKISNIVVSTILLNLALLSTFVSYVLYLVSTKSVTI